MPFVIFSDNYYEAVSAYKSVCMHVNFDWKVMQHIPQWFMSMAQTIQHSNSDTVSCEFIIEIQLDIILNKSPKIRNRKNGRNKIGWVKRAIKRECIRRFFTFIVV